jgi:hypothetical protein
VVRDKEENSGGKAVLKKLDHPIFAVLILMVSVTIFSSCGKPPTEELAQAEKAIQEAKEKGADLYATDLFKEAENALMQAKAFARARGTYDAGRKKAVEAANLANQASLSAEQNRAKMKPAVEEEAKPIEVPNVPSQTFGGK